MATKVYEYCTECGRKATKRRTINQISKICNECSNDDPNAATEQVDEEHRRLSTIHEKSDSNSEHEVLNQDITSTSDYWTNMDRLLDKKFKNFEESFKETIMGEVKQITEPITKEVSELKTENKKLKTEITMLKAKEKDHGEKLEKVEKVLKEHQKTLAYNDKGARSKRLILAGVPEEDTQINGTTMKNDREKVMKVLEILNTTVSTVSMRRIGKKGQGAVKRPRYLLLDFANADERNQVKKKSSALKENKDTKSFYLKADLTKKTREEYKRLYDTKKKILDETPNKSVKIDYGKLYVDEVVVDQIEDDNKDFL